jgi:hypothetical protein
MVKKPHERSKAERNPEADKKQAATLPISRRKSMVVGKIKTKPPAVGFFCDARRSLFFLHRSHY